METRVGGFNPEEYNQGLRWREEASKLPPLNEGEVARTLGILRQREEGYLEYLRRWPDEARSELRRNKDQMTRLKKQVPSRVALTTEKIMHGVFYPMHNAALAVYQNPEFAKQEFTGWYDYASAVIGVVGDTKIAEAEIDGKSHDFALLAVRQIEGKNWQHPMPLERSAELYAMQRKNSRKTGRLLVEDPSGHTLIAKAVSEIQYDSIRPLEERKYHRFEPYQQRELFRAGAEFTERAYNAIYPLTQ